MIRKLNRRNFTFCIDTEDLSKLNDLAIKEEKTVSEIIRSIIKEALEKGQE